MKIDIDIQDYLDEVSDKELIKEVISRAKNKEFRNELFKEMAENNLINYSI